MKLQTIFDQLITYLPLQTDLFSDIVSLSSLTYATSTVTATTASAHGLLTGEVVSIRGALERNSITSLTSANGIATAVTAINHDITEGFQSTVNISGANQSEYNGNKTLLSVVNRTTFTFAIEGTPTSPATGTIFLNENRAYGYNGLFNITVTSPTEFTYTVTRNLEIENGTPEMSVKPRIWTTLNIDRAIEIYSSQETGKYGLFINIPGVNSNRDRNTRTDANYEQIRGQEYRQTLIQPINLYVFTPTTGTVNAGEIRDTIEDIREYLIKSLANAFLTNGTSDTNRRAVTYLNDDIDSYNKAYLVWLYSFESVFDITNDDVFKPLDSVAINSLQINYLNSFDEIVKSDEKEF